MMKTWESISVSSITEHISRFFILLCNLKSERKNNSER
jgi:hypothetical protein